MAKEMQTKRAEKLETTSESSGRNPRGYEDGVSNATALRKNSNPDTMYMMEAVVGRENMRLAVRQVEKNKGAAGIDGMTVDNLSSYLKEHWPRIKEELLEGRYKPQPVRRVEIPKPGGKGMRMLGIPTIVDRLIQQALHQELSLKS